METWPEGMRILRRSAFLLTVVLLGTLAGWSSGVYAQPGRPVVSIQPQVSDLLVGERGQVAVSIENTADATGVAFILAFDADILHFDEVTVGPFIPGCVVQVTSTDNAAGTIDFACITLPLTGATGSGIVAEVGFSCLDSGASTLALSSVEVTDLSAELIPVEVKPASVVCTEAAASPATPRDFGTAPDTGTPAVAAPRTTVIAPAISTVQPQEQKVEPETSVAEAETGSALAESDGGPPVRAISIGAGVGAAAIVLALGVLFQIVRRRGRVPVSRKEQ